MKTWEEIADMYERAAKLAAEASQIDCVASPVAYQIAMDKATKAMSEADTERAEKNRLTLALKHEEIMAIAQSMAADLFKLGSEPNDVCQRIEFKGGHYTGKPETETSLGGFCEIAFAYWLCRAIKKQQTRNDFILNRSEVVK